MKSTKEYLAQGEAVSQSQPHTQKHGYLMGCILFFEDRIKALEAKLEGTQAAPVAPVATPEPPPVIAPPPAPIVPVVVAPPAPVAPVVTTPPVAAPALPL